MAKNEKGGVGVVLLGVLGFVVLVIGVPLFMAVLGLISLPFLGFEKKVELNRGVINKTFSTEYCLDNYHWFKETYQDIEQKKEQVVSFQSQIDSMKATYGSDATKWGFTTQQSFNQTQSNLTGVQNAVLDETGQYNAKAGELDRVACKELPLFVQPN